MALSSALKRSQDVQSLPSVHRNWVFSQPEGTLGLGASFQHTIPSGSKLGLQDGVKLWLPDPAGDPKSPTAANATATDDRRDMCSI